MFSIKNSSSSARHDSPTITPQTAEDLRRAGYHDGERQPRLGHHWANQSSSVLGRTLRWSSKYQVRR